MRNLPKKIKVIITKKVNSYRYEDVSYKPGDEVEIPLRLFREDFMTKVVPPKAVEVLSEKFATEETPEVPPEDPEKKKETKKK